mmetsp:Transcript_27816/g.61262  ORF Transcript_27816/g.61262 Transcript_27816/m.61262 type:complete len:113 (-) Transcript_27816:85-423(-)
MLQLQTWNWKYCIEKRLTSVEQEKFFIWYEWSKVTLKQVASKLLRFSWNSLRSIVDCEIQEGMRYVILEIRTSKKIKPVGNGFPLLLLQYGMILVPKATAADFSGTSVTICL